MRTFDGVKELFNTTAAVFRIPTTAGNVFMRVDRTNYLNEERAVVEVDTKRFFASWQKEPNSLHAALSHGNQESWRADRKYSDAAKGFSMGEENPVPLADVTCYVSTDRDPIIAKKWLFFRTVIGWNESTTPYVAVSNGVTRTIWLAAHEAECFPVECHVREAERLQDLAGVPGTRWRTVADLLPES